MSTPPDFMVYCIKRKVLCLREMGREIDRVELGYETAMNRLHFDTASKFGIEFYRIAKFIGLRAVPVEGERFDVYLKNGSYQNWLGDFLVDPNPDWNMIRKRVSA